MVNRDRETSGGEEVVGESCHILFDLDVDNTSAYKLQVASRGQVPPGATNIRPIQVGSVVQETYDLSDPIRPKPIRKIHTHDPVEINECLLGGHKFQWVTTEDVPMPSNEAKLFRKNHPIIPD